MYRTFSGNCILGLRSLVSFLSFKPINKTFDFVPLVGREVAGWTHVKEIWGKDCHTNGHRTLTGRWIQLLDLLLALPWSLKQRASGTKSCCCKVGLAQTNSIIKKWKIAQDLGTMLPSNLFASE